MRAPTFPKGGVHPADKKSLSKDRPIEVLPVPGELLVSLSQHLGAPAKALKAKGDHVGKGERIGEAAGFISADVHSPVSGTITDIRPVRLANSVLCDAYVIKPDENQPEWPDERYDWKGQSPKELLDQIKEYGIVGMGGATFPTHVKLSVPPDKQVEAVVVNGVECEPYLTTDNREFLEHPDSILQGVTACLTWLDIPNALICIEDNKPAAIDLMQRKTEKNPRISVKVLESRYPQGAQNVLIKNATGRVVARGARHTSVGVMMLNVTTVSSIGKFLATGMPLVTKRLTVAGDAVEHPKNLEVPIGVPIEDVVNYCGTTEEAGKIIIGGPMMGAAQMDVNYPITRQNNGLLIFGKDASARPKATACIRCGRCINSCPMGLSPLDIRNAYYKHDAHALDQLMADLCIGCGTCSYVCPSKRPLTPTVTLAKSFLKTHSDREKR